jgi:hypothetical protein
MGIQTAVAQVALSGGGRVDEAGGILVQERASRLGRARSRDKLYVLAEVSGPAATRDAAARQVARTLCDAYFSQPGSVTAGLQRAVSQANAELLEENRNSLPAERRTAGVTCAVLRDQDLFLAQAGPAAAFLSRGNKVTRFPTVSPWLDGFPPEETDGAALGERRDLSPDLYHSEVGAGDSLLLAGESLARRVAAGAWPAILARDSVDDVLQGVLAAARGEDLAALVVRVMGADKGERVAREPVSAPQPAARKAAAKQVAGAPPAAAGQQAAARKAAERQDAAAHPGAAGQAAAAAGLGLRGRVEQWDAGARLRGAGEAATAALASLGAGGLVFLKRMVPDKRDVQPVRVPAPPVPAAKTAAKKRPPHREAKPPRDLVQRMLIAVAIAIPLVVAVLVALTLIQRGQANRAELSTLWEQADGYWQQSQATSDPPVVRAHLATAQQAVDQILALEPADAQALDLQQKIRSRLDAVNGVKRVSWVGALNTYPADAELDRVVVQGNHVFVLDSGKDRVYHHQLDPALDTALSSDSLQTVLVSKGQQVGSVLVGDLVDMTWMPTGPNRQKASLVILESGGHLLDFDPMTGELLPLQVAGSDAWRFPELVGSHSGRFYLLDSSANKIWRYGPTADGYTDPPEEWLQSEVDLGGAVDMAIADSIYLLYADGTIRKLTLGQPDTFDIAAWDTPLRGPTGLFTRPPEETQWLYIADAGNGRIVQSDQAGTLKQQFRVAETTEGDPLAAARNLFVDEIGGRAFVLSGDQLYLLILPLGEQG